MRVVVTGAAGDPTCSQPLSIGAAAAIELARSADAMSLIDRNGPGLRWTKEQLPAAIDAELVECDLRDPAQPPSGGSVNPGDIASAIAFLVSASGDFITGQTLSVNGGMVTT